MLKPFKDCEFSVFVSYAHADDKAWFGWVTEFSKELKTGLNARLQGTTGFSGTRLHLSGINGPVNGVLIDELRQRVTASFAMVVVVHEQYARSEWCLKELELFKTQFGEDGFKQRLYIVALSETWMNRVKQKPSWKELAPRDDLVWMPFFNDEDTPVEIYMGKGLVAPEFKTPFQRLRESLVSKIKQDLETQNEAFAMPSTASAQAALADDGVRIYIESNNNERQLWEPLGEQIRRKWDKLVEGMHLAPPLYLRPRGLPIDQIEQYPRLDDADGVVLLWGKKEPNALVSQIDKVERKLAGNDVAPGIVAYLMPPQDNPKTSVPAWGWQVLRFSADPADQIDVVQEEAGELDGFLKRILARTNKRRGWPPLAAGATLV